MGILESLLPTPTGTDYKSRGPNSKQVGIDNYLKLLPTPSAQNAGEKIMQECKTKEGQPAKIGERAYNPKTGKHVQITLNRAVSLLPTPRAGNPGSRKPGTGGKILAEEVKNALTCSPEVSPASLSATQESAEARQITAISGLRCLELYEISNQHGSSLRMCVGFLLSSKAWYSSKCALTWKEKVTKSNRTGIGKRGSARQECSIQKREFQQGKPTGREVRSESESERCVSNANNTISAGLQRYSGDDDKKEGRPESVRPNASPNWERNWLEVATKLCGVDDGLPAELDGLKLSKAGHRVERLKALGNAIVPQVAIELMKAIKMRDIFDD